MSRDPGHALVYSMGVSLDGFVAGPDREIDWAAPDEELHRFHNEQLRAVDAHLLGRRLYEEMLYWETVGDDAADAAGDDAAATAGDGGPYELERPDHRCTLASPRGCKASADRPR